MKPEIMIVKSGYEIVDTLGCGAFGKVVKIKSTGGYSAAKIVDEDSNIMVSLFIFTERLLTYSLERV